RHDQAALPLANGREQVHDPRGVVVSAGIQVQPLRGEQWRQEIKGHPIAYLGRILAVDRLHSYQREIFLAFLRRAYAAADRVTGLQTEQFDLRLRYVYIVRGCQVVVIRRTEETITV